MKAILDHVGIAVRDLQAALAFYRDTLGLEIEPAEDVPSQRVRAHFVPAGESSLELLEATSPDSPIAAFVEKRGPGLHHITLRVEDIHAALAQLKARGARLVDEQPRPGAEGGLVAFIHPASAHGVLVELKQPGPLHGADRPPPGASGAEAALQITRYTLGDLELVSLYDGFFSVDGGAVFGTVPRPIWAAAVRPDEHNRVRLAIRQLLVRGVRTLLIDAGIGDKESGALHERYCVDRARHLDHALAEAGVAPDEIDIVLATHLHFDHAGGFTVRDAAGRLRPRFPRARYVARRGEWEEAGRPHERTRGSYRAEDFMPLAEAGVLELVDADQTIMPGVRVQRTGGHTLHHQIVLIESGGRHAAFAADLMPTSAHAAEAWVGALDMYPMETLAAKKAFAAQALELNSLVFFDHDPVIHAGRLVELNGKRSVVPSW
jgi:methylmalonyl-CoA epimerase